MSLLYSDRPDDVPGQGGMARDLGGLCRCGPDAAVLWIIVLGTLVRLIYALCLGLGIDESYMVAAGRTLHIGYFDHPPAAWWITWAATHLFGSESGLVARLPFMALFALSTWLMYRLTRRLFSPQAGVAAALVMNLIPVLSITTGTWVLPDGPLDAALIGAALAMAHGLEARRPASFGWWALAGVLAGVALFSKYTAVGMLFGAFVFLLTSPAHRRWLARPEPYVAAALALAVFSPVLIWNALNDWASFAFQGSRAAAMQLRPLAPLRTLAGEALYVLPWIWLPLMVVTWKALRRGPRADWRGWFCLCLGLPLVAGFVVISLWSSRQVMFHWAAPGYLMLLPLLGEAVARRLAAGDRLTRLWIRTTAILLVGVVVGLAVVIRFDPVPALFARSEAARELALDAVDWNALPEELTRRGLHPGPDDVIAAVNWREAGKLDYAFGGKVPVLCLNMDARQYGFNAWPANYVGRNVIIILRERDDDRARVLAPFFREFRDAGTVSVPLSANSGLPLRVYVGTDLQAWPDKALAD